MNDLFRKSALPVILLALAGCATQGKPPPTISLDEPVQAQPLPEPPAPVEVVAVPEVLPMPAQLKPLPEAEDAKPTPEPADETVRVSRANAEARVAPTREGYVNAIQVWPFTDGALYQVYAAVGRVTVVSLQPGEELVTVAAGDTVRWIVGDTSSGSGADLRVNVLVKPIRSGLKTNLVITTSRRTYLLELASTEKTWMASVSWEYPRDRMLALQRQAQAASAAAPVDSGLSLENLRFATRSAAAIRRGSRCAPSTTGRRSIFQFPAGIAQGELPPLFVIGAQGDGQLVNYRFRSPYYIVDRLFGAAELRLGGDKGDVVRIERTDGVARRTDHEPGRHPRPRHATGGQGRARVGDAARPAASVTRPEPAHAGRPCRRPVGRRARGHDLVAATAAAQRRRTDRAIQRRSRLEVRRAGRSAGRLLEAAAEGARAGAAAAGRPRPCHRELAAAGRGRLRGPGHDPNDALRKEAEAAAASSVFFRSGGQGQAAATVAQATPGAPGEARSRPSTHSRPGRHRWRRSLPTRPPYRTGKTRKRRS